MQAKLFERFVIPQRFSKCFKLIPNFIPFVVIFVSDKALAQSLLFKLSSVSVVLVCNASPSAPIPYLILFAGEKMVIVCLNESE